MPAHRMIAMQTVMAFVTWYMMCRYDYIAFFELLHIFPGLHYSSNYLMTENSRFFHFRIHYLYDVGTAQTRIQHFNQHFIFQYLRLVYFFQFKFILTVAQ